MHVRSRDRLLDGARLFCALPSLESPQSVAVSRGWDWSGGREDRHRFGDDPSLKAQVSLFGRAVGLPLYPRGYAIDHEGSGRGSRT